MRGLFLPMVAACFARGAIAQSVDPSPGTPAPFVLGPPIVDGPVAVRPSFRLLNISSINDDANTVAFSGVLTLEWSDSRQAFDPSEEGVSEKVYSGEYQFNELSPAWFPQVTLVNVAGQYDSRGIVFRVMPDGTCIQIEAIEAVAKVNLDMRWFPFDRQRLDLVFGLIGFDADDVVLGLEPLAVSVESTLTRVPQWTLEGLNASTRAVQVPSVEGMGRASAFVVTVALKRQPLFMLRLVVMPLSLIVVLSWSVFWMDRSSLGDRMSVSFVGILTAVAYQITLGDTLPDVSYITLMNGFLNLSFGIMCASVVVNLVVGAADRHGHKRGARIDRCCRWLFPLAYVGLIVLALTGAFMFH